ncbi:alkane 1-monooxygenase [Roseovarius sp. 2305UL8-3]|uniref:alkane 1-monooxygenase n=1 Tax=Roseovarius conchicola TaxID=3121636 RepID=UPI003527FD49
MHLFAIATITPFLLILTASFAGGVWGWLAVGYITALVFVLDHLIAVQTGNADPEAEFPAADNLLKILGGLHFLLLGCVLWAVAGPNALTWVERALAALSAALAFGQISHPVAHELIHRPSRRLRLMGKLIYTSILFGHHASAHVRVHHVHVGSKNDPNSARWGEGFYRFLLRAWPGGFRAGLQAETRLRRNLQTSWRAHPYALYVGGAVAMCLVSLAMAGGAGLATLIFLSLYAQIQIFLSDYVQHYGLRRATLADGTPEPVGPRHSWNTPHWYSSAMTLNAPRHSDHHMTPSRPYPALQLRDGDMPVLPYSLPVMAVLALLPPLWRKVMDPLCAQWQPDWDGKPKADARSISPAVLARAKAGGVGTTDLPHSPHENDRDSIVHSDQHPGRDGPGPDERRRV